MKQPAPSLHLRIGRVVVTAAHEVDRAHLGRELRAAIERLLPAALAHADENVVRDTARAPAADAVAAVVVRAVAERVSAPMALPARSAPAARRPSGDGA